MDFEWNKHRFSGGVLVLDLVNTVVHRAKPDMRLDRLTAPDRYLGFAQAASKFRSKETGGLRIAAPDSEKEQRALLKLRDVADVHFRPGGKRGLPDQASAASLHKLFSAASTASRFANRPEGSVSLGLACSLSAMRLLCNIEQNSVRACPNCDWLFLDKSKNQSRRWCDMAVCGNRAKAAKHYRNKTTEQFS